MRRPSKAMNILASSLTAGLTTPKVPKQDERGVRVPNGRLAAAGRNDPCPCGSGKKYKKCCGRQSS